MPEVLLKSFHRIVSRVYESKRDNTLYFGCRSESKDCHYADEWKAHSEAQALSYRIAFSRDGTEGVKRTYVQDFMQEDSERIWDIIGRRNGWIYISGYVSVLVISCYSS